MFFKYYCVLLIIIIISNIIINIIINIIVIRLKRHQELELLGFYSKTAIGTYKVRLSVQAEYHLIFLTVPLTGVNSSIPLC